MVFTAKKAVGILMIAGGLILFLVEFKALPHKPSNPEKWDELHRKYFRQIRMGARVLLLLGLTFTMT